MFAGFIRVRMILLGRGNWFAVFIKLRMGLLRRVADFIPACAGSLVRAKCWPGSFEFARVHSGARSGLLVHSGLRVHSDEGSDLRFHSVSLLLIRSRVDVEGFIRVRLGSFVRANALFGSFVFSWAHSGDHRGYRIHSVSLGFTPARIAVAGIICVRVGSLGNS